MLWYAGGRDPLFPPAGPAVRHVIDVLTCRCGRRRMPWTRGGIDDRCRGRRRGGRRHRRGFAGVRPRSRRARGHGARGDDRVPGSGPGREHAGMGRARSTPPRRRAGAAGCRRPHVAPVEAVPRRGWRTCGAPDDDDGPGCRRVAQPPPPRRLPGADRRRSGCRGDRAQGRPRRRAVRRPSTDGLLRGGR